MSVARKTSLGGVEVGSPEIRRALLFSFWDGISAQAMVALNETFAVAAGLRLQASPLAISLLAALPLLFGALFQYFLPVLLNRGWNRKAMVLAGVRLQSAFLFLAAAAGWLPEKWAALGFVAAFALAGISGNATQGIWTSWFGDLLPPARGRYLAWRNQFIAFSYLACSLSAGLLCRNYHAGNAPWILFALVFWGSSLFRAFSYLMLSRQMEPPPVREEIYFSWGYRPSHSFLLFCLATSLFQGAATLSGPFFGVFMVRDLKFDYLQVATATSCTVVGAILFSRLWGAWLDRKGATQVLRTSASLICLVPLLFLFISDPVPIFLANLFSGGMWAGYNLAVFHYHVTSVDSRTRNQSIAFYSLCLGVVGFGFSLLGGFLASRLPELFGYPLRSLFALSLVLRLGVVAFFIVRLRERGEPHGPLPWELLNLKSGVHLLRLVFRPFRQEG